MRNEGHHRRNMQESRLIWMSCKVEPGFQVQAPVLLAWTGLKLGRSITFYIGPKVLNDLKFHLGVAWRLGLWSRSGYFKVLWLQSYTTKSSEFAVLSGHGWHNCRGQPKSKTSLCPWDKQLVPSNGIKTSSARIRGREFKLHCCIAVPTPKSTFPFSVKAHKKDKTFKVQLWKKPKKYIGEWKKVAKQHLRVRLATHE